MGPMKRVVDALLRSDVPLIRGDLEEAARVVAQDEAPLSPGAAAEAVADLVGFGPVDPLLSDDRIGDVLVNADGSVWIERSGTLEKTSVQFADHSSVIAAVERMIAPLGLRIDRASPAVDARLSDGSRLHAVIPPAAVDGPVVAIRRFVAPVANLDELVAIGSIPPDGRAVLGSLVEERQNVIVCGGTGSGKTTLLNALSGEIPRSERIVTVEDAAELQLAGHVVRLEARPPNPEGAGEITLQALVRHALRLRPDRIVVGEVRGPEALDLIQAMSTGHRGSMGTVHADNAEQALSRIEALAMSGDRRVPSDVVHRLLASALDAVIVVERRGSRRAVESVARVIQHDRVEVVAKW